jgi:hypothetical protein
MAESSLYKIAHRAKRCHFSRGGITKKNPASEATRAGLSPVGSGLVRITLSDASQTASVSGRSESRGTTEERPVSEADPIPRPRLYKIAHTVRLFQARTLPISVVSWSAILDLDDVMTVRAAKRGSRAIFLGSARQGQRI